MTNRPESASPPRVPPTELARGIRDTALLEGLGALALLTETQSPTTAKFAVVGFIMASVAEVGRRFFERTE